MKHTVNPQIGIPLALALGLFVTIGEQCIVAVALSQRFEVSDELDSILMNALLVAIPFSTLAFRSSSRVLSWVIAFALTALVRGWWLAKGIAYQQAPDGSGVDMEGALMMLVSPLPITLIAVAVDSALRRYAKGS